MTREHHIHRAKPKPNYKAVVMALSDLLTSAEYPCPGEHGSEPNSGERGYEARRENWEAEWLAAHGYPADPEERYCVTCRQRVWDHVADYELRIPDMPEEKDFVLAGRCDGTITVTLDEEYGEYGGGVISSWPVAEGPCAEKLGLDTCDDPSDLDYGVFQRYMEREYLLHAFQQLIRQHHVQL